MKQVLVSGGSVRLENVPAPLVEPGTVLVKTDHSCISVGTEMSGVRSSGTSLLTRAIQQPQHVRKVLNLILSDGITHAKRVVQDRLSHESPTGYSLSGVVVEVGRDIDDIFPGDRVACAGSQCAYHAEVVRIPRNLVVRLPDRVGFDEGSTVALGAIAMQGLRRAAPTLGEMFAVVGLGALGQLTAQLLSQNGCRVIGIDLDSNRLDLAKRFGMDWGVYPAENADLEMVNRLTGGYGVDGVIITAATPSSSIIATAFKMCRKKARVVIVGDIGLNLNRADFYEKELDIFISTSYGPGRYDKTYEEDGCDYPIEYVRWTENRNMAEYLMLLEQEKIFVKPLIESIHSIDEVEHAYSSLQLTVPKPLMVLLKYPNRKEVFKTRTQIVTTRQRTARDSRIRVAVIGAGSFAKGMHLPNILDLSDTYALRAVVSRTGHSAYASSVRFKADYCATDYREVLEDNETEAVIIATRHDLHGKIALEALKAGKHVLLEKPLSVQNEDLLALEDFFKANHQEKPLLLTGFNRRFSPYAVSIAKQMRGRTNPMIINYRMNAGYIPLGHWVHSTEGGGRNIGEACHIYDLFTFFTDAEVTRVHATSIIPHTDYYSPYDNFVATMNFVDGSIGTLTYTALGSSEYPKESMEVFVDGKVIALNDYRRMTTQGGVAHALSTRSPDKGQKQELIAFASAIKGKTPWPIPWWQQVQATRISYEVDRLLSGPTRGEQIEA